MGAATLSAAVLLDLALAPNVHPRVRLLLLTAERAGVDGIALFDHDELCELLADDDGPRSPRTVHHCIAIGVKGGGLLLGSTSRRVLLSPDWVLPLGDGLAVGDVASGLTILRTFPDGRRVLGQCRTCGAQRVWSLGFIESGAARCCQPLQAAA